MFVYLGITIANQNIIHVESKNRINSGRTFSHAVLNILSSHFFLNQTKVYLLLSLPLLPLEHWGACLDQRSYYFLELLYTSGR